MSVSRSFFDRLGVGFGVDLGSILALKSDPNRRKNGIDFGIDFRCLVWKKVEPIPGPGAPWGTPHMRAFSTRKNEKARIQQEKT